MNMHTITRSHPARFAAAALTAMAVSAVAVGSVSSPAAAASPVDVTVVADCDGPYSVITIGGVNLGGDEIHVEVRSTRQDTGGEVVFLPLDLQPGGDFQFQSSAPGDSGHGATVIVDGEVVTVVPPQACDGVIHDVTATANPWCTNGTPFVLVHVVNAGNVPEPVSFAIDDAGQTDGVAMFVLEGSEDVLLSASGSGPYHLEVTTPAQGVVGTVHLDDSATICGQPTETVPAETVPAETVPAETVPAGSLPPGVAELPPGTVPTVPTGPTGPTLPETGGGVGLAASAAVLVAVGLVLLRLRRAGSTAGR